MVVHIMGVLPGRAGKERQRANDATSESEEKRSEDKSSGEGSRDKNSGETLAGKWTKEEVMSECRRQGLGSKEMSKRASKRNIRSITDSDEKEDDEQGREEECLERGRTQLEKYGVEDIADICSDWRETKRSLRRKTEHNDASDLRRSSKKPDGKRQERALFFTSSAGGWFWV